MNVLTVTLNPCIDRTLYVKELDRNGLVRSDKEFVTAGGKGANVARQLVRLGTSASAFVLIGGDSGSIYLDALECDGVKALPYRVQQETRWQETFREKKSDSYYTVLQEAQPVPRRHERGIVDAIAKKLRATRCLILSGSTPGDGLCRVYRKVTEKANGRTIRVVLDTYGKALIEGVKGSPFMVKPNRKECEEFLGFELTRDSDFRKAYRAFRSKGIEFVVISLGRKGFRASFKGIEYVVQPPKIKEVNPVASGDALVAGIVHALLKGLPMATALRWGAAAGAANAAVWEVANSPKRDISKLLPGVKITERAY
jgi:1-phosphofructokinase family hexose kinase